MGLEHIRNFCVIAHIDHGKSTLADRLLELTGTIEKRKMQNQVLDRMELERERGITIKMKPVRMLYRLGAEHYTLNLIDTPGHIDFSYEVSRALGAVEGAILLVDATQGIEAQTLSVLEMAREQGLVIIPAVNKIDSPLARVRETKREISKLLNCSEEEILAVSGKTGEGVPELLNEVIKRVPPPRQLIGGAAAGWPAFRGLVFDFEYSNHTGVILFVRVFDGRISKDDKLKLFVGKREFRPVGIGIFMPGEVAADTLSAGEIGYVITGAKEPGIAFVGDTVTLARNPLPSLPGFMKPTPVVFASIYPESQDDFVILRRALERLKLSDSSFSAEEEASGLLGKGFRCGFLGVLHLEIVTERLRREFNLQLVVTTPSITFEVLEKSGRRRTVYSPVYFPDQGEIKEVREPWVAVTIIVPADHLGVLMPLFHDHEAVLGETESFGDGRAKLSLSMPLRELMRGFFDRIKSLTSGFASLSYSLADFRTADVVKLEVLVAEEVVPAFSKVIARRRVEEEAEATVERLYKILPRQLFTVKIQAKALGRILASRTLSALRKDVTGYLYGGDITRKMKLWQKQKAGKKRLKARGRVEIPHDVFLKMVQGERR